MIFFFKTDLHGAQIQLKSNFRPIKSVQDNIIYDNFSSFLSHSRPRCLTLLSSLFVSVHYS